MKNFIIITFGISSLLIASSLFYYFVIALPTVHQQEQALKQAEVDLKQQEFAQKQLKAGERSVDLSNCLLEAKAQQKKDAENLTQSMNSIGCQDSSGNTVETKGCMTAFVQSWDEIKLDYSNAEAACYSRYN